MRGALCISIDLELAWGAWDRPDATSQARCAELEHAIVRGLIDVFSCHDVNATWAIVGRLLELDPSAARSSRHGARIWYAPEIVELVRSAPVPQDIGSHSYAHVYFQETSREALRADLQAARRVHEAHGLPFSSFVFPRNQVAHTDLLREAGIKVFRSTDLGWHMHARERLGRTAGRLANLADKLLPVPPSAAFPIDRDGITELPSSMLLLGRNGLRRAIHPAAVIAKARLGLRRARDTGGVFHLWFHPSNFYYDLDRQLAILDAIVADAARMRSRGEIDIRSMASFAN